MAFLCGVLNKCKEFVFEVYDEASFSLAKCNFKDATLAVCLYFYVVSYVHTFIWAKFPAIRLCYRLSATLAYKNMCFFEVPGISFSTCICTQARCFIDRNVSFSEIHTRVSRMFL